MEPLPEFRYHADPVASGSVVASDAECRVCGKARGYVYTGPVYAEEDLDDAVCPWCIADGTAAQKFDATFVDSEALMGDVREKVMTQVIERTPGFNSWQSEQWPVCCGDATRFVMPAGYMDLVGPDGLDGVAVTYVVQQMGISGRAAINLVESLNRDRGPTAFLFECLHCGRKHLYIDRP
jgi:uncharacterized protein CbrC (UPF0167 family)